MYHNALAFLACPICGDELFLADHIGNDEDITSGIVGCKQGCGRYPIQDGVPILLPERCQQKYEQEELQGRTRNRFSAEWHMYRYGDTTWGITVEERLPVVLYELGWSEKEVAGKVVLDAGCGNGTLSRGLADLGATVVAVDLSDGVFRAEQCCRHENLHFVQGNLYFPPFKPGVFDAIYSCGVFHHTPDTRKCFKSLVSTLKNSNETRYFVWLYSQRSTLFNLTVEPLMKVTRRLPTQVLVPLCYVLAPVIEVASRSLTALGMYNYGSRTLRDRAIQTHDLLAPAFVWYHSFNEVKEWACEAGFEQIQQTDYDPRKGNVCSGLKRLLDQYRSICRPGFGILCKGLRVGVR
ncbi:MAG: methyltransferase domain-containing protein [Sedimentisphaerales bacterium]